MRSSVVGAVLAGVSVMLLIALLVLQSYAAPAAAVQPAQQTAAGLTVTGRGSVTTAPDLAVVRLGVSSRSQSAREASEQTNRAMEELVQTLQRSGVARKDIQTAEFSLFAEREREERLGQPPTLAYVARHIVSVKVRELDNLGTLLDAVTQASANEIHGISFTVEDPEPLRRQAREQAVEAARERAQELARLAGVGLGPLVSLSESFPGGPIPFAMARAEAAAPVEPGELEIESQVTLVYAIR